jgi:predicted O-methyltransferase YrrM
MDEYSQKLEEFLFKEIKDIQNLRVLEFGVRHGISTKRFLEIIKKNKGHLYSIDMDDCSHVANDANWTFIKSRDDDFSFIESKIPEKFDLIYLDSFHSALHIKKIIYHYFSKLKKDCFFFIDDISWLPYVKDNYRNNFNCEINNKETFYMLLEILRSNRENIDIYFSFIGSGMCKIIKKSDSNLNKHKKILSRSFSIKNFLRKFFIK